MKVKFLTVVAATCALPVLAQVKLGSPFSDGLVLQRGMKAPVWGSAGAGHEVTVSFAGQEKTSVVGADGKWEVALDPLAASREGRVMTVVEEETGSSGSTVDTVEIKDVLVGEVWFASGQSNMECPIWGGNTRYRDGKGGLMTQMTDLPLVRYIAPYNKWSPTPLALDYKWSRFVPTDLAKSKSISAVAFYFARELHLALGIPVGIVSANWGGTNIDAWTPRCGYEGCDPSIRATADYTVRDSKAWDNKYRSGPIGGPQQQPTVLFNGMVAAYAPMAIRGFIWYQGCHNSGESPLYCAKMHALYNGWSRAFRNPDLKLYFAQLAPFCHNWMGICMQQNKFVDEQKNAAIAVTADVGNFDDIHPNDKETVAQRLVAHALKRDYGVAIREDDSPRARSVAFAGGEATVAFDHVKSWYVYAPNHSKDAAFELAGKDGKWKPAKIVNWKIGKDRKGNPCATDFVDGGKLVLKSAEVAEPVAVRYMGRDRTSGTMYNEASLPLGPFELR